MGYWGRSRESTDQTQRREMAVGRNPLPRPAPHYSLSGSSPDRILLRRSSWLCPLLHIHFLHCSIFYIFTSPIPPALPKVDNVELSRPQVEHEGPKNQGLCQEVLCWKTQVIFCPALSWESLQDKLSVTSQDGLGQGWEKLSRVLAKLGRKRNLTSCPVYHYA